MSLYQSLIHSFIHKYAHALVSVLIMCSDLSYLLLVLALCFVFLSLHKGVKSASNKATLGVVCV